MKRIGFALTAALAALAVGVAPAAAITKNFQPDPDHTFVGLVVFYDSPAHSTIAARGSSSPRPSC